MLYLGSKKKNLVFGGKICEPHFRETLLIAGVILLSKDNKILKDFNGLYLTAKEDK